MLRQCIRPSVLLVVVALLTFSLSGCVPTTWLPDSSGFIYLRQMADKHELCHYDVNKKISRVIVDDIGPNTVWPAVSPDGKRIAVARWEIGGGIRVIVYDFQGKKIQMSKEFKFFPPWAGLHTPWPAMLFWSPKNDKVVMTEMFPETCVIYDLLKDSAEIVKNAIPVIHGGTPIRPDGTGLLLMKNTDTKPRLVFMTWDGVEQLILDTNGLDQLTTPANEIALAPLFQPSGWEQDTAWGGSKRGKAHYEINTVTKKISGADILAAFGQDVFGSTKSIRFDFAGDIAVDLVPLGAGKPYRVATINYKTKKEITLLAKTAGTAMLLPSPDGKYLALGLAAGLNDLRSSGILVITSNGEMHAKITTFE